MRRWNVPSPVIPLLALLAAIPACGDDDSGTDAGDLPSEACLADLPPAVTSPTRLLVEPGSVEASYPLAFDQPVSGVDAESVTLVRVRGGSGSVPLRFGAVDDTRWTVTFATDDWQPNDAFELRVGAGVHDACGLPPAEPFVADLLLRPGAGQAIDRRTELELASSYELPTQFYDALTTLGLEPDDLYYPDAGSTYRTTPTRLNWTDTIRHQGDLAPTFGYRVVEVLEAALAEPDDRRLPALLAAQHVFNIRDALVDVRYDEPFVVDDSDRPLLDALRAFYEHPPLAGNPWTAPAPWSALEADLIVRTDRLPYRTQAMLALAVRALLRAADLRDEALLALGVYDTTLWEMAHEYFRSGASGFSPYSHFYGTEAYPAFDFERMVKAGQLAARAVESLRLALAGEPAVEGASFELTGPLGRLAVSFEDRDDAWTGGDFFLLVDGRGNDTYRGSVAANNTLYQPVSVVLDLTGDDVYRPVEDWDVSEGFLADEAAAAQGAGLLGVAILDDAEGDDDYHAAWVSQGYGLFGVGILADHAGADRYRGYSNCQGSGDFGYGLLLDRGAGIDRYETLQKSQGYGGPRGMGWLVDDGGNDTYVAIADPIIWDWAGEGSNWSGSQGFGFGVRDGFFTEGGPIFSGGLGGLFDLAGDDDYQCAVMCQGFGYAFGTGLFYDAAGDDDHLVTHKYAMGAATHWAVGLLLDEGGADTYRNDDDDECIAEGYDASVAFHIDRGDGDDVYTLDNVGDFVLGVSRIPALGVLINEGGDDEYHVPGAGSFALGRTFTDEGNRAGYLADVPSVGMFLDLGGTADLYDAARTDTANDREWIQSDPLGGDWTPGVDFGYGLDSE